MRKESRANIIFFLVLLVLILPGFVILMRKKLSGPTDPAHLPPMVPHEAAYIQPEPVPPRAPRREPVAVKEWVAQQLRERVGADAALARDSTGAGPVVGDRYVTQLVHVDDTRLVLLIWSSEVEQARIELYQPDADVSRPPDAVAPVWIDVPKDIRHALQNVGYIDPPERIAWFDMRLPFLPPSGTRFNVSYSGHKELLTVPSSAGD